MTHTPIKRRTALQAGAWSAPLLLASAAVPAYAASSPTSSVPDQPYLTDLAIEIADPPINWDTFAPVFSTPIYGGRTSNQSIGDGSLPTHFTVTNVGTKPARFPSGTLEMQMRDVGTDVPSAGGADGTKVISADSSATISLLSGKSANGGAMFSWTYNGTLQPGQSVEIPFKYYVNYPFANVNYELFIAAIVMDEMQGDYDDNSERMGTVEGFARYNFWTP